MPNEADTCRRYVVPKLQAAGWEDEPHRINEQVTFTDGRIVVTGRRGRRRPGKRADYILRYRPDFPIAVVEAKPSYETPGQGMQQAKEYAEILDLKFAYATNGHGIVEFDYTTGLEREIDQFPTPDELWRRLASGDGLEQDVAARLFTPTYDLSGKRPRYYQEIAINRAVHQPVADTVVRSIVRKPCSSRLRRLAHAGLRESMQRRRFRHAQSPKSPVSGFRRVRAGDVAGLQQSGGMKRWATAASLKSGVGGRPVPCTEVFTSGYIDLGRCCIMVRASARSAENPVCRTPWRKWKNFWRK